MEDPLEAGFYLRDLLVETRRGHVTSPEGTSRYLPPKAVAVLLCLAKRPGEIVTRQELLANARTSGAAGSLSGLTHAIAEIRQALGDEPGHPRFIQTVPGSG